MDMPLVAQEPTVTMSTPTPPAQRGDKREGRTSLTNILRSVFTEASAIVMIAFLFEKLSEFWRVEHFVGATNSNFWMLGAIVGGILGLFVSFRLYLSNKHP